MPLYEYHCNDCDTEFEKIVGFSEANLSQECPSCRSQHTEKKISRVAAVGASLGNSIGSTGLNCGSSGRFS